MLKKFTGNLSQKEKSLKELYKLIFENGSVSKGDLIKLTGMRQTTCTRLIDELLVSGLIKECGYGESSGGRKPLMYEINKNINYVIGIDISRTYTKILLMDLSFSIIAQAKFKMNETTTPDVTIDLIISHINKMMKLYQLTKDDILGIGIGTIGPLNREKGIIINPNNFPSDGWENIKICERLNDVLQLHTILEYGANTALLAEYSQEPFNQFRNVIHVIKGTGTRTGIIMDGRLVLGTDKLSSLGQGHMIVDLYGRKCSCGSNGCINAYSSISAMKNDIIDAIQQGAPSLITNKVSNIEDIDFNDICQAVNDGDPLSTRIVQNAAYYTGVGLANLAQVLFPDLIILSGPTYTNMELFYDVVTSTASKRCEKMYSNQRIIFSRGQLGENATAIGAGRIVLEHFLADSASNGTLNKLYI
ncbi:ROK family protein [Bacillus massiliigorillae]|uniref:ROK family protein n=1 Tax=Bacillus massiliigorillae TaxID=1243664 RepID=UPI0003A92FC3|nr:ROK family protein [Bacillus massiliigorillae]